MQCNLEISKLKKNAVLYRDETGKIICLTKDEFLKEHDGRIKQLEEKWTLKVQELNNMKKKFEEEWELKKLEMTAFQKGIYEFIEIMKGTSK
jgi:hypothetical protein